MSLRTPLYETHVAEKAKIVDFAGWEMPIHYQSITQEHQTVRESAGLFDVSHMGRFWFSGENARDDVNRLIVSRIDNLDKGQARYTIVCNPQGGAKDDIIVTKLAEDGYLAVVNASNREKLLEWFNQNLSDKTKLHDCTFETGMFAIQGPNALQIVNTLFNQDFADLPYFQARDLGDHILVSRTGYTGEDGCEIIAPNEKIVEFWRKARELGAQPTGLGARDSLRLEMGYPLYGHELTEEITPLEAGLGWAVHLKKDDFIGKEVLQQQKENGIPRRRLPFVVEGKGIPREGYALYDGDTEIGYVTSGGFSTTLKQGIGLGLVKADHVKPQALAVEIRKRMIPAKKVKLPFVSKKVKADN